MTTPEMWCTRAGWRQRGFLTMMIAACLQTAGLAEAGDVQPYILFPKATKSTAYRVFVADTEIPTEELQFGEKVNVASWAGSFPVEVRVQRVAGKIDKCRVRPVRRRIEAVLRDGEARFQLTQASHLLIEVNDGPWLTLFADSMEDLEATKPRGKVLLYQDPPDAGGKSEKHPLQSALEALAKEGGGPRLGRPDLRRSGRSAARTPCRCLIRMPGAPSGRPPTCAC